MMRKSLIGDARRSMMIENEARAADRIELAGNAAAPVVADAEMAA